MAYNTIFLDPDLEHLKICTSQDTADLIHGIYAVYSKATPTHLQWSSNALLYLFWAKCNTPDIFSLVLLDPSFINYTIECSA